MTSAELGLFSEEAHRRPSVFLLYAPADAERARRLKADLLHRGIIIGPDEPEEPNAITQQERQRQAIAGTEAIILLASPNAHSSPTIGEALECAEPYRRAVLVFWIDGERWREVVPPHQPALQMLNAVDARDDRYEAAVDELISRLERVPSQSMMVIRPKPETAFVPRNPYKGLRAFTHEEARDFFGRNELIDTLADKLEQILIQGEKGEVGARLLPIIGPSGSGKSSLVMAGLLPRLEKGEILGSQHWIYLRPMVPGTRPLEALTATLGCSLPERSLTAIRADLEDERGRGLHELALQLTRGRETRVMFVVDQFEELFIQTTNEQERKQFLHLLLTASTELRGPVIILLTLRADFYDRPLYYREIGQLIAQQSTSILPMSTRELQAVIEQPAALPDVQLTFEGDLVRELLLEMQAQAGALPLLQFTLERLFHDRRGSQLTMQGYRTMGGVKGALAKHAEATYQALPSETHRQLARTLFLGLIDPGTTVQETTRRRAALTEFLFADLEQTRLMQETLDRFTQARLLTVMAKDRLQTPTIEVSHEALLQEWPQIMDWVREARDDVHRQQDINEAAALWERSNHSPDHLYRGLRLKIAQEWARRNSISKQAQAFLHASDRREKRSLWIRGATVVLLLTSFLAAGWFYINRAPTPGYVTTTDEYATGSLRWAIGTAREGDTITFAPDLAGRTFVLTGDLLITEKHLNIYGPSGGITLSNKIHQIHVYTNTSINISNITFMGSQSNTTSLFLNDGTLTLTNCIISGNRALPAPGFDDRNADGGGIQNTGTLTLINSQVRGNTVSGKGGGAGGGDTAASGGGIANFGKLTLINSTVSGNSASGSVSLGGGISNTGTLTLTNSTVSNNTVSSTALFGNVGIPSDGGGISSGGTGSVTLMNSTVSGNTASRGGGISNGAGITLMLINSTISDNIAIGHDGGGLLNYDGEVEIIFCTFYHNKAAAGGGVSSGLSQIVMRNSLVAGNVASLNPDIEAALTSEGYNLIQNTSGLTLFDPDHMHRTDLFGIPFSDLHIDPRLQQNGGPTQTLALLPGSPAIDAIPPTDCLIQVKGIAITADQRGVKRPQGSACDIGAYEYQVSSATANRPVMQTPTATTNMPAATATEANRRQTCANNYRQATTTNGTMFGFDAQHTGTNPFECILNHENVATLILRWVASAGGDILSPPVVANGIVYVGSDDHYLHALDANTGERLWASPTEGNVLSSPAVANGIVYIGSDDRKLYAFDASTGKQLWVSLTGGPAYSGLTVANGTVYISGDKLSAFDASTGKQLWTSPTCKAIISSPAVANGVVYAGSLDNKLCAFDANTGKQLWASSTGGNTYLSESAPMVANGIVYIGSGDNKLYALDANTGKQLWASPTGGAIHSSPVVANGIVYSVSNYKLYAFSLP